MTVTQPTKPLRPARYPSVQVWFRLQMAVAGKETMKKYKVNAAVAAHSRTGLTELPVS